MPALVMLGERPLVVVVHPFREIFRDVVGSQVAASDGERVGRTGARRSAPLPRAPCPRPSSAVAASTHPCTASTFLRLSVLPESRFASAEEAEAMRATLAAADLLVEVEAEFGL